MSTPNFDLAFKDPSTVPTEQLDEILEAQLDAVRHIKKLLGTSEERPARKKPQKARSGVQRSNLRRINNRI